jgi:Protein of unknown function (DUF2589)
MASAQPELISMAEQFTGLPMRDLIGGPLMAAAEANGMMAVAQTRFLLDTAFSLTKTGGDNPTDAYNPVMIQMKLTRGVLVPTDPTADPPQEPRIDEVVTTFDLPLLTILPLNSLAVDDVSIKFDMEVKSSFTDVSSQKTDEKIAAESSFSAKVGYGIFSAEITGKASYDRTSSNGRETHYEKGNNARYSVSVHAGQLPLPEGVKTIIGAFSNAITPITMPTVGPKLPKLPAERRRLYMNHHLPCPLCRSQIPVVFRLLARGATLHCPNAACGAAISIAGHSLSTFASALGKYERLEALNLAQRESPP